MLSRISVKASITVVTKESLEASWPWFSLDGEGLESISESTKTSSVCSGTELMILGCSEIWRFGCSEFTKFSRLDKIRLCSSICGCSDVDCSDVGCSDFST